ncbi:uncharacterized protein LOC144631366 [Oculina patagonica]
MSEFLNPFQILLNNLSNELHEIDLHSLIHVCGDLIPGGQRERISSGWDVFSILRQQNVIGNEPEKIANLLAIFKVLKPRRRDLVVKIKRHIQENYEEAEMILQDFESSDSNLPFPMISSRASTPTPQEDCCRIRCCGFVCNFNPCCDACCCCVILAILFTFFAVAAALAWYTNIPELNKYINSKDDLKQSGPYVIGGLGFLAACSVACGVYIRYFRPRDVQSYAALPAFPETSSMVASYAASDSTGRRIQHSRQHSCSSGRYTASSSVASRASRASYASRIPRLLDDHDEVVPDGPLQDDYPEFFSQDSVDHDEDAPIVV